MSDSDGTVDEDWWRLAPAEVLKLEFPSTPVGRRGLQPEAVEQFRRWVVDSLDRAGAESAALRAEIERLHSYIRSQWGRDGTGSVGAGSVGAGSAGAGSVDGDTHPLPGPQHHGAGEPGASGAPDRADAPGANGAGAAHGAGAVGGATGATGPGVSSDPAQGRTPIGEALEVLKRAQAIADERLAAADAALAEAQRRRHEADAMVEAAEKRAALAREQARHTVLEADEVIEDRWRRAEQQIAARMAQAQDEALDVVARACHEYEDILNRAHCRAEHAAERALDDLRDESALDHPGGVVPPDLELKAAYLQTFSRISGAALRAALDITRQEVARLHRDGEPGGPELPAYRILETGEVHVIGGMAAPPCSPEPVTAPGPSPVYSRPAALSAR